MLISFCLAVSLPGRFFNFFCLGLSKVLPAQRKLCLRGRSVESVRSNDLRVRFRHMQEVSLDKIIGRQCHRALFVGSRKPMAEGDAFVRVRYDALVRDRSASDVPGQINQDAFAVLVTLPDMHVPLGPAKFVLEVLPPLYRHAVRESKAIFFDRVVDVCKVLSAKHGHDRAHGKKVALLGPADPLSVGDAALGYQAMDVRMQDERLAPGMECRDDPRLRSDMPIVQEESEQRVAHCREQDVGHLSDVVKPQIAKLVRWREDHVVMTALHQAVSLPIEPQVQSETIALRTGTVPA